MKILKFTIFLILLIQNTGNSQQTGSEDSKSNEISIETKYNIMFNFIKRNALELGFEHGILGVNFNKFILNYYKGNGINSFKEIISANWVNDTSAEQEKLAKKLFAETIETIKSSFLSEVNNSYLELTELDCQKLRNGKFRADMTGNSDFITINRNGSQQIESFRGNNYYYLVEWKDKCECEFKAVSSFEKDYKELDLEIVVSRIYQINNDSYITLTMGRETGKITSLELEIIE